MNESALMWGVLFSSLGLAYFVYGKKQRRGVPFASGIGLMVFPYFVSNSWLMVLIGAALTALPYFLRY